MLRRECGRQWISLRFSIGLFTTDICKSLCRPDYLFILVEDVGGSWREYSFVTR